MKNRFSELLENLVNVVGVKHYVLANHLQYDTSYISKWVSGKMLPGEKTYRYVIDGICQCIYENGTPEGLESLISEYNLKDESEIKPAIFDHLIAEYEYVKKTDSDVNMDLESNVRFEPTMSMQEYISRMKHPSLRKVNDLHIISVVDLFSIAEEYRCNFFDLSDGTGPKSREYPNVHLSLIINMDQEKEAFFHMLFLIGMIGSLGNVDFNIYCHWFPKGKSIFAIDKEYIISGMLQNDAQCFGVTSCEGEKKVSPAYQSLEAMCNSQYALFLKNQGDDAFYMGDYMHELMSFNKKWVIGRINEVLLPPEVVWNIVNSDRFDELNVSQETVSTVERMVWGILKKHKNPFLIFKNALTSFVFHGNISFFGKTIQLTMEERRLVLQHILTFFTEEFPKVEIRLFNERLAYGMSENIAYNILAVDQVSYITLFNSSQAMDTIMEVNLPEVQKIFRQSVDDVWEGNDNLVESEATGIKNYLNHLIENISLFE